MRISDWSSDVCSSDLSGGADAAGVCGGEMTLGLRRWQGEADALRARCIADALADGRCIALTADDLGHDDATDFAHPNPRLLIVGGGHCGIALYDLARDRKSTRLNSSH